MAELPKHLKSAISQLEKQVKQYAAQRLKHSNKAFEEQEKADVLAHQIDTIWDQIRAIKGEPVSRETKESSAETLKSVTEEAFKLVD